MINDDAVNKSTMRRVNCILINETYQSCLSAIGECEKDRIFCRHNMGHLLDVARLAYIINLEEKYKVKKEYIYAAALLHDIGRHIQYQKDIPHEKAGVPIARGILEACGYQEHEIKAILEAIENHRNISIKAVKNLAGLIYRSDKMSRCCFACKAQAECHKAPEKRRMEL